MPFSGDWQTYVEQIYARYVEDLVHNPKQLMGRAIRVRYTPATQDKHFNFWHVISEGQTEDERQPDMRRCERIGWIGWIIERANAADERIRSWTNTRTLSRGTRVRRLLCKRPVIPP